MMGQILAIFALCDPLGPSVHAVFLGENHRDLSRELPVFVCAKRMIFFRELRCAKT